MENTYVHKDLSNYHSLTVGMLSDTHGYVDPYIHERLSNCDVILHAGDIGSLSVIHDLNQHTEHVISVRGNNDIHEKWSSTEHEGLNVIPKYAEITLSGGKIALIHGEQFDPVQKRHHKLREHFSTARTIVYGHSHILVCDQQNQPWVLNPGAAGRVRTKGGASCLVMKTNKNRWKVTEYRKQQSV